VPAASGAAGSNSNPLSPTVQSLLGTVNGLSVLPTAAVVAHEPSVPIRFGSHGGPPPGPAFGTSSVPPPVSGAGPAAAIRTRHHFRRLTRRGRGVPQLR
jgi:hypothetical protein